MIDFPYHPAATLTGGYVPAHVDGAYPTLACCGGTIALVPAEPVDESRPVIRYRLGDTVRVINPRSTYRHSVGTVTAILDLGDHPDIRVTFPWMSKRALPFGASELELANAGDRAFASVVGHTDPTSPSREEDPEC